MRKLYIWETLTQNKYKSWLKNDKKKNWKQDFLFFDSYFYTCITYFVQKLSDQTQIKSNILVITDVLLLKCCSLRTSLTVWGQKNMAPVKVLMNLPIFTFNYSKLTYRKVCMVSKWKISKPPPLMTWTQAKSIPKIVLIKVSHPPCPFIISIYEWLWNFYKTLIKVKKEYNQIGLQAVYIHRVLKWFALPRYI